MKWAVEGLREQINRSKKLKMRLASTRAVVAFALFPMMGAVSPLLAYPAIAGRFGEAGWSSIAVGQSVGSAVSVVIELGWVLTGPQAIASAPHSERLVIFAVALRSRLMIASIALPLAVGVVCLLEPPDVLAAAMASVAMGLTGLSGTWFFIGLGKPGGIFVTDALPRLLAAILGVCAITVVGLGLEAFVALMIVGYLASPLLTLLVVKPSWGVIRHARASSGVLREQLVALVGRGASATYIGLPSALIQAFAPSAVAVFAAVERLMRLGLLVLQAVPNSLQHSLGKARLEGRVPQVIPSIITLQIASGVISGALCWLAVPYAVHLLFTQRLSVSNEVAALAGLVVLLTSTSRGTGLVLVAMDRLSWIAASGVIAALGGLAVIGPLAGEYGPTGGFLALVVAESMALCIQMVGLVWVWRVGRVPHSEAPHPMRSSTPIG